MSAVMSSQAVYEENNDDLLDLLTDAWENPLKETIKDAHWIHDYLTRLTSLSLDQLLHEPLELRQEQANAIKDAQQLACNEYPLLLHAQTCRDTIEGAMDGLDDQLEQFIQSVPELEEACRVFESHANTIKQERNKIARVIEHQQVLADVLEIPQLMETCVRNSYYSEAMDLASHVRLLSVRYPLPIIHSIQQQVQASSDRMLIQLISHLRKPVRLAAAMNMIGFLRRMDVFNSEAELRMMFLRCRHDYLQQRLLRIKRDLSEDVRQRSVDAFEYTKKFIDVMREQMFETGTQYVSIFPHEQDSLLPDYMIHVTQLIKSTLTTYLPMIEDTSFLASLLNQLQYCGMSLGRIGLDFRNIFVHLFEEALQPMLIRWINSATEELMAIISKATMEGSLPSTWMASKTTSTTQTKRNAFQPPMLLVGYPSLAVFTNSILSTFNSLRLLPAFSLCQPIISHLNACFLDIGVALKHYGDYVQKNMPDEIIFLQSYSAAYAQCCIPYLKSCLIDGIYGHLATPKKDEGAVEHVLQAHLPVRAREPEVPELQQDQQPSDSNKVRESKEVRNIDDTKTSKETDLKNEKSDNNNENTNENKEENSEPKEVEENNEIVDTTNISQKKEGPPLSQEVKKDNEDEEKSEETKQSAKEEPTDEMTKEEPTDEMTKEEPTDEMAKEETAKEETANEEPTNEEPTNEEPIKEEPTKEETANEEPTNEEPIKEEPTNEMAKEEPTKEETAKEESTKEETAKKESINEETAKEESTKEEPTNEMAKEDSAAETAKEEPEKNEKAKTKEKIEMETENEEGEAGETKTQEGEKKEEKNETNTEEEQKTKTLQENAKEIEESNEKSSSAKAKQDQQGAKTESKPKANQKKKHKNKKGKR